MRLGIDLGGTKIEIVALDADGGERFRHRVPTPHGDYDGDARCDRGARRAMPSALVAIATRRTSASARRDRSRARRAFCAARIPSASTGSRSRRSRARARPRRAHQQRRQLLRAVGGVGRRGRGAARRVRRDPRHRRRRGHRRARSRCSTDRTASRASGATIRCRGRATTSGPVAPAICGRAAASRRGCPGRASSAITCAPRGDDAADRANRRARRGRRRGLRRHAGALRGAPRARARARDQPARSRRDRAGRRDVERRIACTTNGARRCGARWVFSDRVDTQLVRTRTAIRAACAAPRGCGRSEGEGGG